MHLSESPWRSGLRVHLLYANPGVGSPWRLRHGGSRVGQRRPELIDELYQTWREVEQRGLKETPEYRDVLLREIGTLGGLQEW